ncbi:MAG TPA: BNR-4 repeat-containing protein [Clostridia bacterium]|nr:BNR-4 repeat-containing protein [Clostridia bacterium]
MKSLFLVLCICMAGATNAAPPTGIWQLQPGVEVRGAKPGSWELDLRNQTSGSAQTAATRLSTRLYGSAHGDLHQPMVFYTESQHPKVFALFVDAVSASGSDLVIKTNGVVAGRQVWSSAASTHQTDHILHVPLQAGSNQVRLEVTQPAGVVVITRYFLADSVDQLPSQPVPVAFGAGSLAIAAPPQYKAQPTGGKLKADDGYRGIWYYNQNINNDYKYKYSGGFATYPYQHVPIAIYCKEVEKTFFVYGGTTARKAGDKQELLHMVSYYDHKTGKVPRPLILLNKQTEDAHDNPTLQVDDNGFLWIFSSAHGTGRPSYIHRSMKPWSIDEFERILLSNFSYTQPWHVPGEGFLFLHTRYGGGKPRGINAARCLFWITSPDGKNWAEPEMLAGIGQGDYQVSWRSGKRVATAFDFHPNPDGLNARANVYYLQTQDLGRTWQNVRGDTVDVPLVNPNNPALAYDSQPDNRLVYLMDICFERDQLPVILFLTSKGFEPGPENGPREWQTLRWDGTRWIRRPVTTSGNNYDHGSLYVETDGTWRVIGPTETGPQPYNTGGEMALWTSQDQGETWTRDKRLTRNSRYNHTFARRPVNAHPDFYALWADGHGRQPSESSIYFTDRDGTCVKRLPVRMDDDFAVPEEVR